MVRRLLKVIAFLVLCMLLHNGCSKVPNFNGAYQLSSLDGVSVDTLNASETTEDGRPLEEFYKIVIKDDKADFIIGDEVTKLDVRYDGSKVIMEGDGIVLSGSLKGKKLSLTMDNKELVYKKVKA